MEIIHEAAMEFLLRKSGHIKPKGNFDHSGRWYPSEMPPTEMRECCHAIRPPSKAFPFSMYKQCCSLKHVANLFEVTPAELRAAIKPVNLILLMGRTRVLDIQIELILKKRKR